MSPNLLMTEFISDFQFVEIGTVKTVYGKGKRIDVLLPYKRPDKQEDLLHGVELLQYGNALAKVTIPPQVGDVVLVFLPRSSIADAQAKAEPEQRKISYYNPIGYKAILLQGAIEQNAVKTEITVTDAGALTINCKGEVNINGHLTIAGTGEE